MIQFGHTPKPDTNRYADNGFRRLVANTVILARDYERGEANRPTALEQAAVALRAVYDQGVGE